MERDDVEIRRTGAGIEYVRTPDERFENLPGHPFEPRYAEVDGLRMHYVEEGPDGGEIVLLLHGQPTWSYLYRKMIPPLAKAGHRVIAPDLIGMGRSDKPTSLTIHTLAQHVAWMKSFVERLGLRDVTLFGQDWGSIIGLRCVGENPDLFARVMIANGDLPPIPAGATLFTFPDRATATIDAEAPAIDFEGLKQEMFESANPLEAFQRWITFALTSPHFRSSDVVDASTVCSLTREELDAYDAPFPDVRYRAGPRTLPSMVAGIQGGNDRAWEELGRFEKPFLSIAGEQDGLLGTRAIQDRLTGHIPGAAGQPHERIEAHHFIQEDAGPLLADRLDRLIRGTPRA